MLGLQPNHVSKRGHWNPTWDRFVYTNTMSCFQIILTSFTTWWRHQMETSSALLTLCAGNSPVTVEFPLTKTSHAELWCFFIFAWINSWINNREAGDLRRHRAHYDVIVLIRWTLLLPQLKPLFNALQIITCITIRIWNRRKTCP